MEAGELACAKSSVVSKHSDHQNLTVIHFPSVSVYWLKSKEAFYVHCMSRRTQAYHVFDSISSISVSDTIPPCVHTLFCPEPSQSLPKQVNLSRSRVAQGGRVDMGAFRGQRTIFRQSTCTDIKIHSPVSLGPCISKKTVSQPLPDYGYFN